MRESSSKIASSKTASSKIDLSYNDILASLPAKDASRLRPHLQMIDYKLTHVLFNPDESTRYVYFPQNGSVVSLIAPLKDGRDFEVCLVGREGLAGLWELLGAKTYKYRAVVQVQGAILRIKRDVLQAEFKRGGALQDRIHRYIRYALTQISQTAACNRAHRLEQRLARWLLMTRDRAGSNEFPATHEFLSNMLGAPRSEVTLAAGALRKAGVISYFRGKVTVLNPAKLESTACECYKIVNDELAVVGG